MKIWEVWFYNQNIKASTFVQANSFDEAIGIARSLDMRYDSARVYRDEEEAN